MNDKKREYHDRATDPAKLAAALSVVSQMPVGKLGRVPKQQMERFERAALDLAFGCMAELRRRKEMPRGRQRLRLVAIEGGLTDAGLRSLNARKAARARWRRSA